jgi:hypothetical protein
MSKYLELKVDILGMKKKLDNLLTKAEKRDTKKRPRMQMHGAALRKTNEYAGKKLATKK